VDEARKNVKKLGESLAHMENVQVVTPESHARPAYWVMLLFVQNRDRVLQLLREAGVMASALHQRNDAYTGFRSKEMRPLPQTDYLQKHILAIPCGWWLKPGDIEIISEALTCAVSRAGQD
jgi:dTDP-4-amino-4,6-dideoxygalactose transaminase